jgi:hypothetical protein
MNLTKREPLLVGGPALARRRRAVFQSRFAAYPGCSTDAYRAGFCLRLIFAVLVVVLFDTEAFACTVNRVLSAKEIAAAANVIVRAKATRFVAKGQADQFGEVVFEVKERLKGSWPSQFLTVTGHVKQYRGPNDRPAPYDFVRPGGRLGSCFAYDYKLEAEFLLFLLDGDLYWAPLAAINEQVRGGDDPWVVWVREELRRR